MSRLHRNHHTTAQQLADRTVPVVPMTATIGQVEQLLLRQTRDFHSINYIYIINPQRQLLGVLSIKEIFNRPKSTIVGAIPRGPLVSVKTDARPRDIAFLALQSGLKEIPVVDDRGHWRGTILHETIMQSLHTHLRRDYLRLAGIPIHHGQYVNHDILHTSIWYAVAHRAPWLILGLGGGLITASVINGFTNVLQHNLVLAAFIPLTVYMSDAVGTQMEALIIRDTALRPHLPFGRYFFRQLAVVGMLALVTSCLLYIVTVVTIPVLAPVISIAMFCSVMSTVITGLVIPYTFFRLRFDPANASGPIATTIQDLISVVIYFAVAGWLL